MTSAKNDLSRGRRISDSARLFTRIVSDAENFAKPENLPAEVWPLLDAPMEASPWPQG